ncbi:hypothetical protein CCR75_008971 [Bremia lactucae]|uniref:Peroxin-5 n=1 Tax=Bremia lactucae TaxID=4779 RepID=A0A976IK56_BRELC|nr:hypothetical protein CCR75_008971 [Bremia lactucae]
MDVLGKIVQGTGCAVDGTVATQNPLSRALESIVQSHSRGHQSRGATPHFGTQSDLQMQMQRLKATPQADSRFLSASDQEAVSRLNMEAAYRSGEVQQHMTFAHHASMEAAFKEAQHSHFQHYSELEVQHSRRQHEAWNEGLRASYFDDAWQKSGKLDGDEAWRDLKRTVLVKNQSLDHETLVASQQASTEMTHTMLQNPDPKFQKSQFLKFMNQVSNGEVLIDDEKNEAVGGEHKIDNVLENVWKDTMNVRSNQGVLDASWKQTSKASAGAYRNAVAQASAPHVYPLIKAWDDKNTAQSKGLEVALKTAEEKTDERAWSESDDLEAIWDKAMAGAQTTDSFEDAWDNATNQSYAYKAENPYLALAENYHNGVEYFRSGHLNDAILVFEAEVQQHPDNSEAWRMLGECHAENDEDKSAIICLERAVEEDPYNLSALLALGVSNVNELNSQGALKTLKAWVQHNPKFHGLKIQTDEYSDGSLMDEVMQLMLQARAHDQNDSDVQVVLGVLYNVSKDFDAAVESFKAAKDSRPDEYALWNKIGATLANSARSSEAIPAYHRALELKPRYARGWLNLGISHANLGNYEEAAKCYLQALSLNSRADHIWSFLRICFTCMERYELVKIADMRDIAYFREEFKLINM